MAFNMFVANLMARFSADTSGFDKSIRTANASLRRSAEDMTQLGRTMTMAITAPILGVGVASVKMAMDFETSMTKIITLVGIGRDEVEKWTPAVKAMAGETGVAAGELAEALFYITSAGIRGANAMNVLEASAKASAIGMGDTQSVAYAAVSAMNAYGEANLTAEMAVSTLIRTVRMGNMEAASLPMAFGRVLPVAAELGIKFQDVGASMAMMTRSGVTARLSAFALRSILMTMVAPTAESTKAMHELGMTWEEIRQVAVKDGLLVALQKVREATKGNTEAFQNVIPNSRAFIGALQLVGKNAEYSDMVFQHLSETVEGDVQETFDTWSKTSAADMKKAFAEISEAAVNFGSTLMPVTAALRVGATAVSKVAEGFYLLPPVLQLAIHGVVGFAAATGVLVLATGMFLRAKVGLLGATQKLIGASGIETLSTVKQTASINLQAMATMRLRMAKQGLTLEMTKGTAKIGSGIIALRGLSAAAHLATAALGALSVGFVVANILEWLYKLSGAEKAVMTADSSINMFTKTLQKNQDAFERTQVLLAGVAAELKDYRLEWIMNAEWTDINARKMAELHDVLVPLVHQTRLEADALANMTAAEKHHLSYMSKEQALIRSLANMRIENNKAIREEYDLVTSPEVRLAVRHLAAEYENLKTQGIPLPLIWEAMEDKVKDALKLTYEYGETASEAIRKMAADMKENGLPAFQQYIDKLDAGVETLDDLKNKLSGAYDVMTRQDVKDSFASILKDMKAMKDAGIPMADIWAAVEDKMKKTSEWAAKYGMGVGDGFRDMNYELMNNGITALDTYIAELGVGFTEATNALPAQLLPGMLAIKQQLGEQLKGGFGEGYQAGRQMLTDEQIAIKDQLMAGAATGLGTGFGTGFESGRTQANKFIEEMAKRQIVIPVVPDEAVWWKFFDDIANGRRPDIGG